MVPPHGMQVTPASFMASLRTGGSAFIPAGSPTPPPAAGALQPAQAPQAPQSAGLQSTVLTGPLGAGGGTAYPTKTLTGQ
jgi:hypothetical protein